MSKEIGPRERALREQREAAYEANQKRMREQSKAEKLDGLKERVADELRARAFTRRTMTRAWIDPDNGLLVIDAAAPAKAEQLVSTLRDSVAGFGAQPLETEKSPEVSMGAWLMFGDAPGRFNIEDDLELRSVDDAKSKVRYVHHPLEGKEVQKHVSSGKTPTRLGMSWQDKLSFVLTADMQIKRLQFLDVNKEGSQESGAAVDEQFDIDFALMSGELAQMLKDMIEVLGGETQAGDQRAAA